ncbi:Glucitol operon repressor [compost metagenome]
MVGMADSVILLADSSKYGVQAFTHVADLHDIHMLITDAGLSAEGAAELEQRGITVKTV